VQRKVKASKEELEFWIKVWQQPYNKRRSKYNRARQKRLSEKRIKDDTNTNIQ
jgi:hypothetical protein